MDMKCKDCKKRFDIIKFDYSKIGCEHTKLEGFACTAFGIEGQIIWMTGLDENKAMCECYMPKEDKIDRINNK